MTIEDELKRDASIHTATPAGWNEKKPKKKKRKPQDVEEALRTLYELTGFTPPPPTHKQDSSSPNTSD